MTNRFTTLVVINLIVFQLGLALLITKERSQPQISVRPSEVQTPAEPPKQPEVEPPIRYHITTPVPNHLDYPEVVSQLQKWREEAPKLTEMGTYGKSSEGRDLVYFRISNPKTHGDKPRVLFMADIHGNESWSCAVAMACIGTILDRYNEDEAITELVNTRELYFVPVVMPDNYHNRRESEGVDPNRNFPTEQDPNKVSIKPIQALREFFLQIHPNAIISGHTFGRVFLQPYGDTKKMCPNHQDFQRIVGKMAEMCHYNLIRACDNYRQPIFGTEVDWFYRHGAFSILPNGKRIHRGAFSIVMEIGTHQREPTYDEITSEFNRTFPAILYFMKESPKVEIWWDEQGNPVNADGTPKIPGWKAAA